MKKYILITALLVFCLFLQQSNCTAQSDPAGDWKLKTYYMVLLKSGPVRNQDSLEVEKIQNAHLANIGKLFDEKLLVLAGPFLDEGSYKGIFLFDVPTEEEAEQLVMTDPAVIAGRLSYEIHPWMGPVISISKK